MDCAFEPRAPMAVPVAGSQARCPVRHGQVPTGGLDGLGEPSVRGA